MVVSPIADGTPSKHFTPAMAKFGIFRDSELATDCDQCGGRVDLLKGGACVRCRRILCFRHLHGSFMRRLATDLGAQMLCVRCRAGERDLDAGVTS